MRAISINIILTIFTCAYAGATANDTSLTSARQDVTVGAGAGFGLLGAGYDLSFFYQNTHDLLGVKYLRNHEIVAEFTLDAPEEVRFSRPIESIWELDLVAGKTVTDRGFTASITAGVSVIGGTVRGKLLSAPTYSSTYYEYEHLNQTTLGIPVEARLAFTPEKHFDLGVSGFLNLNSKKTLKGFLLSFRLLCPIFSFAG